MRGTAILIVLAVATILPGCTTVKSPKLEKSKQPIADAESEPLRNIQVIRYNTLVGVVALQQIAKGWLKWNRLQSHLKREEEKYKKKVEKLTASASKKEKELNLFKMGTEEHEKAEREYFNARIDLKYWTHKHGQELEKKAEGYSKELIGEIESVINYYGRLHDYDLIVTKREASIKNLDLKELRNYAATKSVVYYSPKIDLTKAIIKELNEKYIILLSFCFS
jgi:Skp family chaperone for outer membrane proteins